MAFKKKDPTPAPGLFRAVEGFIYQGSILVGIGDVAEAGHPILKGREHLFAPVVPRFAKGSAEPVADIAPEPQPDPEPEPQPDPEPEPQPDPEPAPDAPEA